MQQQFFMIKLKLPSLNELINVTRTNKYQAAAFKKDIEEAIGWSIKQAQTKGLQKVTEPCDILIDFFESTKRRDVDNIQSSTKYILDAMQKCGVLPNDNRKWVRQIYHRIIEAEQDYCIVYIFPLGRVSIKIE